MKKLLFVLLLLLFLFIPRKALAVAPVIQNISSPTTGSTYTRMEWVFDLSKTYQNPYYSYDPTDTASVNPTDVTWLGINGISVDINLTTPSGKSLKLPAFWMEDYTRVNDPNFSSLGDEVLGKKDNGRWHIRFSPMEVGTYQYSITAQDSDGTGIYPASGTQSFTVTASGKKGFVRTSSKDSRFMSFDDGSSYIPIGSGRQWWNDNVARSFDYENAFTTFKQNGVNLTRIWDDVDFALSLEGAGQPYWIDQNTVYGAAQGVEVNTANVHSGLRSAIPSVGHNWYQRVAFTDPTKPHELTVWIKTNSVSGGVAQVNVRTGTAYNSGTLLGQTTGVSGTTGWTQYSFTFTPNTSVGAVNLIQTAGTGTVYIDDIAMGPTDSSGNITYNIITDGGFERHFFNGNPNNDPNADPTLPRPIGTFMNQYQDYEYDKIVQAAENDSVYIQDCSCSGPWFTWPQNISQTTDTDYAQPWILKYQERTFRYKVARWGYSTAILDWEYANEQGHINPTGTPNLWNFFLTYGAYQKSTDIYGHMRTTSQNSGAYSPGMWSSSFMDLANIHNYIDGHYPSIDNDDVKFVNQFAWCIRDIANNPTTSPFCTGLGLGDGTTWSGAPKPWIWGELGVASALNASTPLPAANTGTGGAWFLHNKTWAGLFSPLGVGPLEWWWYNEDSTATNGKFAATLAASTFFTGVDYDGGNFIYLTTPNEITGYTGETITSSDSTARVLGMRRSDKKAAYLWIQNRNHLYQNAATTITPINPTITIGNMLSTDTYTIRVYNTSTGAVTLTTSQTPTNGNISLAISNLSDDVAVKIESTTLPVSTPTPTLAGNPTLTPTPTIVLGNGDVNGDGKVDVLDVKQILSNWFNVGGLPNDQYGDGVVNSMDFTRVVLQMPPPSPTGSSTPQTITLQIASSADDVNETDTSFDPSSTTIWLGGCGSTSICDTGLRFTNVTIPKGATIQSAHLDVQSTTAQWLTVGYNLFSELSPNSSPFSSTSKPSGRPLSQNKATVSDDVSWLANTTYSLPDMASAIQEVVNQSTWQSGNSLSIIAQATTPSGFGRKFITSFDGSTVSAPKLIITYLTSGGSGTTPTPPSTTNTPTPAGPTPTPGQTASTEWSQFGHDAERTNYTAQTVSTPWKLLWQWNASGSDGKRQASHLSVPDMIQPVTGGGFIYMIANNTVYALDKNTGNVIWSKGSIGTLNATPAYDTGNLYVASSNNTIYKLNATSGATIATFIGDAGFNYAPLYMNGVIYAGSANGTLYAVNSATMTQKWSYTGGSSTATPVAYALSKNLLIYLTHDLYVHAVNATDGTRKWRVKPTSRVYECITISGSSDTCNVDGSGAQAENGWPVIAEQHGIVFVRYRLDWNTLWTWNPYPTTNSAIRADLQGQPDQQALFALNLTDGSQAFIPAVGNGGAGDGGTLPMGPQPVVKLLSTGQEVAYIIWRNGLTCAAGYCDGREDATMGEMVLDNTTVSGYQAGDMRFIRFADIQTDEMVYLTMIGDILIHNHWLDAEAVQITDRSDSLGATFTSPIKDSDAPNIVWREDGTTANDPCTFDATTHYCASGLVGYETDPTAGHRLFPPGFYEYYLDWPPSGDAFVTSSANQIIVKAPDGGLMVLQNGNPLARATSSQKIAALPLKSKVLSAQAPVTINYKDAKAYLGKKVIVEGVIQSAVNHLPKAIYLGFKNPHDGALLVRIFNKDIKKFSYNPMTLLHKKVKVTGTITPYWPQLVDPEIIVTDPKQISIE